MDIGKPCNIKHLSPRRWERRRSRPVSNGEKQLLALKRPVHTEVDWEWGWSNIDLYVHGLVGRKWMNGPANRWMSEQMYVQTNQQIHLDGLANRWTCSGVATNEVVRQMPRKKFGSLIINVVTNATGMERQHMTNLHWKPSKTVPSHITKVTIRSCTLYCALITPDEGSFPD